METPHARSNSKLRWNIFTSIIFIILGIYLMTEKANDTTDFNPTIVKGVGALLIAVFALVIILSVKKLLYFKRE